MSKLVRYGRADWLIGALLLLAGCEGEHREYDGSRFSILPDASARGAAQPAPMMTGSASSPALPGAPEAASNPTRLELTNGTPCNAADECASQNCEAAIGGSRICCSRPCSALQLSCTADGLDCVSCEGNAAACAGTISRSCSNGQTVEQTCGNGCDAASGRCNALRPTGSLCDEPAQCEAGLCALDVSGTLRCCGTDCEASGRVCGSDGACTCPADTDPIGEACRLRLGEACAQGSECGTGFCAGTIPGATVCCAQACAGAFCAADGSRCVECEGSASTCQGNMAVRCENGALVRTQCNNRCNTQTGVCNGLLPSGQACSTSGQCATNLCASDASGVQRCCTPNCAATGRVCGTDGSCVCANPNDVFTGSGCGCPAGTKSCGDGRCIANNQCCETCSGGRVCQAGNCNCPNGQQFVNGQCRLNLGAACSPTGTPCATGLCVDGVCCESACDGTCMQCQAGSGRCVMPADDASCPSVACSTPNNPCQQSGGNITTNRCASIGQCKTAANCTVANRPARTVCDIGVSIDCQGAGPCTLNRLCDGSGSCRAPIVSCGDINREISANACCVLEFPPSTGTPEVFASSCDPAAFGVITAFCDGESDCPNGNVCCLNDFGNFNSIACSTACDNIAVPDTGVVCRSPNGGASPCPRGTACTAIANLPGWSTCQ